jgi:hypothetical protein
MANSNCMVFLIALYIDATILLCSPVVRDVQGIKTGIWVGSINDGLVFAEKDLSKLLASRKVCVV